VAIGPDFPLGDDGRIHGGIGPRERAIALHGLLVEPKQRQELSLHELGGVSTATNKKYVELECSPLATQIVPGLGRMLSTATLYGKRIDMVHISGRHKDKSFSRHLPR